MKPLSRRQLEDFVAIMDRISMFCAGMAILCAVSWFEPTDFFSLTVSSLILFFCFYFFYAFIASATIHYLGYYIEEEDNE